ncbi:hypothetical protein QQP08_021568 [Theobroma cacao]|nr:hypothetical protein QQP08_021568 [Theobroma cacao]
MYLNLSDSNFAGQVPSQVSHLSKLVSLDLSQNYYQPLGRHTLEGLVENLTEARQLSLGDINMFSINPNALTNLSSSLRALNLEASKIFPSPARLLPKTPLGVMKRPPFHGNSLHPSKT